MKIKTAWISAQYAEEFDRKVNAALCDGWILKRREIFPALAAGRNSMLYAEFEKPDKAPVPDPTEEGRRILLEPDVAYLIDIKRGMSTRDDYANMALELGMLVADKFEGKIDAAINGLFTFDEEEIPDEEE